MTSTATARALVSSLAVVSLVVIHSLQITICRRIDRRRDIVEGAGRGSGPLCSTQDIVTLAVVAIVTVDGF